MRPGVWRPPVELSAAEQAVVRAIRRAKVFVFLRVHRHELFDDGFQGELAAVDADRPKGQPPVPPVPPVPPAPPAQLAPVTVLQAYTGASDAEAVEALAMDRRWRLVAGCLGAER